MFIRKIRIGSHSRKTMYAIYIEAEEAGTLFPIELSRYDSLELAALALRFIKGVAMSDSDMATARKAIRESGTVRDRDIAI